MFFVTILSAVSAFPIPGLLLQSPTSDSFYSAPKDLESLHNGEVYNSREITSNVQFPLTFAKVEQIAYRTTDTQGNVSHSVATVYSPLIPSADAKLFSYQLYEDSANIDCSPSYSLAKGLLSPDWFSVSPDTSVSISFGLSKGWYVVVPDHEGARSGFIAGHEQGQAGLDGIRAAISHLQLESQVPVALMGYSGGASATVWMTNLHESYAPEINIVGAAHGGTPVDLTATIDLLDNKSNLFSGFIIGALDGLLNSYPPLQDALWPHLQPSLKNAIVNARQPGFCASNLVTSYMHQEWHTMADVNLMNFAPFEEILGNESLLKNLSTTIISVPKFPRYIWHANNDQVIPISAIHQYVEEQCEAGANIQFVPWAGSEHLSTMVLGLPDALRFVAQALESRTPSVVCGTANHDILTLGSELLGATLGQVIADLLNSISEITTPFGSTIQLANVHES